MDNEGNRTLAELWDVFRNTDYSYDDVEAMFCHPEMDSDGIRQLVKEIGDVGKSMFCVMNPRVPVDILNTHLEEALHPQRSVYVSSFNPLIAQNKVLTRDMALAMLDNRLTGWQVATRIMENKGLSISDLVFLLENVTNEQARGEMHNLFYVFEFEETALKIKNELANRYGTELEDIPLSMVLNVYGFKA